VINCSVWKALVRLAVDRIAVTQMMDYLASLAELELELELGRERRSAAKASRKARGLPMTTLAADRAARPRAPDAR
jgi:hypothetical protein